MNNSVSHSVIDQEYADRIANIVELEYLVYSAFAGKFDGMAVERSYRGTELHIPLASGQTAVVTIDVKPEDKEAPGKARLPLNSTST